MITSAVTLPIELDGGIAMDANEARELGELLTADYCNAQPFPHIVMDSILPDALIKEMLLNFPVDSIGSDKIFDIGYGGHHKRQVMPEDCNAFNRGLFHFFNSRPVLQFLEGLTGIKGLLPDPYFEGGGFHETSRGGKLGIHADFRVNERLHVQRRLNLLIYLNPTWNDEWHGQLELWDREMKACVERVSPILNRCVVFNTDSDTWHGHPDELATPEGITRRSMALYYYTASKEIYGEVPTMSTLYKARPGDSSAIKSEAFKYQFDQYFRQWAPPAIARGLYRVKRGIIKVVKKLRNNP